MRRRVTGIKYSIFWENVRDEERIPRFCPSNAKWWITQASSIQWSYADKQGFVHRVDVPPTTKDWLLLPISLGSDSKGEWRKRWGIGMPSKKNQTFMFCLHHPSFSNSNSNVNELHICLNYWMSRTMCINLLYNDRRSHVCDSVPCRANIFCSYTNHVHVLILCYLRYFRSTLYIYRRRIEGAMPVNCQIPNIIIQTAMGKTYRI